MPDLQKSTTYAPFGGYSEYVSSLNRLALESRLGDNWNSRVDAALNGQASIELRRVAPIETRRKYGAFFTGSDLSARLIDHSTNIGPESVFFDPTCGMGDLLVAAARKLPLSSNLQKTLFKWGRQLTGTDLHQEFIEGARTRLVLLARQRHNTDEVLKIPHVELFPQIRVSDGLGAITLAKNASNLLLNPPFGLADSPQGCKWAGGRITHAAEFVIAALEQAKPGAELLAILPDVLRSGSFTEQWRKKVAALANVSLVEPYGIFDNSADVDVFLLRAIKRQVETDITTHDWVGLPASTNKIIGDFFEVHVGRVVPHRDPETGPNHPYIHARCVPAWITMKSFTEHRKHEGRVYTPPFVAIRRTSRPGHPYRATATIIAGKIPVAVENHLIVCEPKDGTIATCQALMRQLKTESVNKFLDQRIRCRHLTVGAVLGIPFSGRATMKKRNS
jgi:hypothetical protein